MLKLKDVCRHIRSKNAGPFWVTVDLFFKSADDFARYHASDAIGPDVLGRLLGAEPATMKYYPVEDLSVLKISYPRRTSQGGMIERDLHSGQQYIRIVDVDLDLA